MLSFLKYVRICLILSFLEVFFNQVKAQEAQNLKFGGPELQQITSESEGILFSERGIKLRDTGTDAFWQSQSFPIPFTSLSSLRSFFIRLDFDAKSSFPYIIEYQFSDVAGKLSSWVPLHADHEGGMDAGVFLSSLVFVPFEIEELSLRIQFKDVKELIDIENLHLGFFQPGKSETNISANRDYLVDECNCPMPQFIDRVAWGSPDGNDASCSAISFAPVSHIIIHHSATSNESDDWAGVVQSIWNFHKNGRGWCDIGYNWLIDPEGVVYLGRGGGEDVIGAHFCGTNTGTMGICMLGTFDEQSPTEAALMSLDSLLLWKSCQSELEPTNLALLPSSGEVIPVISGHRIGCSTACPGDSLFSRLNSLRSSVDETLDTCDVITSVLGDVRIGGFDIYPNPSGESPVLSIELHKALIGRVKVLNQEGKEMINQIYDLPLGRTNLQIGHSDWPSGLYRIIWQAEKHMIAKSWLKL